MHDRDRESDQADAQADTLDQGEPDERAARLGAQWVLVSRVVR
jgi:hypothetical protein